MTHPILLSSAFPLCVELAVASISASDQQALVSLRSSLSLRELYGLRIHRLGLLSKSRF